MRRRDVLEVLGGALVAAPTLARAQHYPSRPVRLLVGFPAGGTTDIVARLIGQWLSDRLGTLFVIENKAGAGTNLATEALVRAPGDGYTLLVSTPANAINATFYRLDFDFKRDTAPVATLIRSPYVLVANPAFPAATVGEFVAYAKTNPGKVNIASFGTGSGSHLSGEMFKMITGVNTVHVPYRGSAPMLTDLISGQVQVAFDNLPASIEHIRAGRLRALAVTTKGRAETLPNVPALDEFLSGFDASSWLAVVAPHDTPAEIVALLNREINTGLSDDKMKAQLARLGAAAFTSTPAETAKFIADETEKWAKVVKFSGAKPD